MKLENSKRTLLKLLVAQYFVGRHDVLYSGTEPRTVISDSDKRFQVDSDSIDDMLDEMFETSYEQSLTRAAIGENERTAIRDKYRAAKNWTLLAAKEKPSKDWPDPWRTHTFYHSQAIAPRYDLQGNVRSRTYTIDINLITEVLSKNNFYHQNQKKIILALRGCKLINSTASSGSRVKVAWCYPDMYNQNCLIGVVDLEKNIISLCEGSTVPHARYMYSQRAIGSGFENFHCNMMLTGFYNYKVGVHGLSFKKKARKVPGALRLVDKAWVLRCDSDALHYDIRNRLVSFTSPANDNIHPAWTKKDINFRHGSAGCLVVDGAMKGWAATGQWKKFRAALGLTEQKPKASYEQSLISTREDDAKVFKCALLSGFELFAYRTNSVFRRNYSMVRFGSKDTSDDKVARLQKKLKVSQDGDFGFESVEALLKYQRRVNGWPIGSATIE